MLEYFDRIAFVAERIVFRRRCSWFVSKHRPRSMRLHSRIKHVCGWGVLKETIGLTETYIFAWFPKECQDVSKRVNNIMHVKNECLVQERCQKDVEQVSR